ncbi:MAG: DOMON-like domain-containing protein [Cyanobacteria bacterium J06600_6]
MKSDFILIPFNQDTAPQVNITGKVQRQDNQLAIAYKLSGTDILIPPLANSPKRQFDLWLHTCCEFFLCIPDSSQYWEFNLSPAGHWNVFRFLDYRQNIAEETAFETLPFEVISQSDYLEVNLTVDLNQIIATTQHLQLGVTAVIEDRQHQLSYWALSHPGKEADFHLRESMAIFL